MPAKSIAPSSLAALTRASGSSRLSPGVGEGAEDSADEEEEAAVAEAEAETAEELPPPALDGLTAAPRTSADASYEAAAVAAYST